MVNLPPLGKVLDDLQYFVAGFFNPDAAFPKSNWKLLYGLLTIDS